MVFLVVEHRRFVPEPVGIEDGGIGEPAASAAKDARGRTAAVIRTDAGGASVLLGAEMAEINDGFISIIDPRRGEHRSRFFADAVAFRGVASEILRRREPPFHVMHGERTGRIEVEADAPASQPVTLHFARVKFLDVAHDSREPRAIARRRLAVGGGEIDEDQLAPGGLVLPGGEPAQALHGARRLGSRVGSADAAGQQGQRDGQEKWNVRKCRHDGCGYTGFWVRA